MSVNLRHRGCGGFFHSCWEQGRKRMFRCEKCEAWSLVTAQDDASVARRREKTAREVAEWEARMAAAPPVAPPVPIRAATPLETLLLAAYREWSEEHYAAGFIGGHAAEFREWLQRQHIYENYEAEMLAEFEQLGGVPTDAS